MNKTFKVLSIAFLSGLVIGMPEFKATGLLTQQDFMEEGASGQGLVVKPSMGDAANELDLPCDDVFRVRWGDCHPHEYLPELLHGSEGVRILREMEVIKDNPPMLLTFASLLPEDFANHAGLPKLMEALGLERFNALLKRLDQSDINPLFRRHVDCFVGRFSDVPDNSQEENLQAFLTSCKAISAELPDEYLNNITDFCFMKLLAMEDAEERVRFAYKSFNNILSPALSEVNIKKKSKLIMQLALFPNLDEIEKAAELACRFFLLLPQDKCDVGLVLVSFLEENSLQEMRDILSSSRKPRALDVSDNDDENYYYRCTTALIFALVIFNEGQDFLALVKSYMT